jgi:hypothetical protein
LDHLAPLQYTLLKSLLDLVVAIAWVCWHRFTEWRDERRARAAEQGPPALRLETWRVMLAETPRAMWVKPRRVRLVNTGVVAVLVSQSQTAERVRSALGERASLLFTSTWAELQQVVARVTPSAIIADPLADESGDPVPHLARFSEGWRIPVVLYTRLTPRSAEMLLSLGQLGVRHLFFRGYDDTPAQFAAAFPRDRSGGPPSQAA